jgi:hypothetical protein
MQPSLNSSELGNDYYSSSNFQIYAAWIDTATASNVLNNEL